MGRGVVDYPFISAEQIWREAKAAGVILNLPEYWPVLSPDHPLRAVQCERKTAYLYLEMAVHRAVARMRQSGQKIRVYACPWELAYHLSHLNYDNAD